jgi:hypothetical protein
VIARGNTTRRRKFNNGKEVNSKKSTYKENLVVGLCPNGVGYETRERLPPYTTAFLERNIVLPHERVI